MGLTIASVEFFDRNRLSERAVGSLNALIDVPIIVVSVQSREIECDHPALGINEEGGISGVMTGVDAVAQVDGRAPAQVLIGIVAESGVNLQMLIAGQAPAGKEQPVAVRC